MTFRKGEIEHSYGRAVINGSPVRGDDFVFSELHRLRYRNQFLQIDLVASFSQNFKGATWFSMFFELYCFTVAF